MCYNTIVFYDDLSDYEYFQRAYRPHTVNIGWLDKDHVFPTGKLPDGFLDALWDCYQVSFNQTRGSHACEYCQVTSESHPWGDVVTATGWRDGTQFDVPWLKIYARRRGVRIWLGTAEIRVFGQPGHIYAAPDLLFHYIEAHDYLPPAEFTAAVLSGPRPLAVEYFDRLRQHQLPWHTPYGDWTDGPPRFPATSPPAHGIVNTTDHHTEQLSRDEQRFVSLADVVHMSKAKVLGHFASEQRAEALRQKFLEWAWAAECKDLLVAALVLGDMIGFVPENAPLLDLLSNCVWHGYQKWIQDHLEELQLESPTPT